MRSIDAITVLVNPAAATNRGKHSWAAVSARFDALFDGYECTVIETTSRAQTIETAATAKTDLIISVGGDGTVHDIAQGIMRRPREDRPALTVIPIGSGNDYAKTLGIPSDPQGALEAIATGRRVAIDVGRCNGEYYLETLSFGVDAAIALQTEEMRLTTKTRGFFLYARSAISVIIRELKAHRFHITTEAGETVDDDLLICAVQIGPTYGGGFIVTPGAVTDDGLLDVCMGREMGTVNALYHLALLSRGKHEGSARFRTLTARSLTIDLETEVPAQFDGERLIGTHFEIECVERAIDVLVPQNSKL
jgi:YegS/Rv2252/BmrU family lipid kinase